MKRVLIFIVSYNAEKTINDVLARCPDELFDNNSFQTEILLIDDSSKDQTLEKAIDYAKDNLQCPLHAMANPVNLGYGGNQKLGYHYAIENGYDYVVLLHGDGQYAPEELPRLLQPLIEDEADVVFGSRMLTRSGALKGGMPRYKYFGNILLTKLQNLLVGSALSEFHTGYRIYSCETLKSIPFERNSDDFDFDTDIILQLTAQKARVRELAIPTFYGDEVCHVNGLKYAWDVTKTSLQYRLQKFGIFYNRKFDLLEQESPYEPKFHFPSSHSMALDAVAEGDRVLLLGCGPLENVRPFVEKASSTTAVDMMSFNGVDGLVDDFILADLNNFDFDSLGSSDRFDTVLILDVIEHLNSPEEFMLKLREFCGKESPKVVLTTPNIAFMPIRLMLLAGGFNYGPRGILDETHTRLFTFASLSRLLEQYGFIVKSKAAIPAPYPLAIGSGALANALLSLNMLWNKILPRSGAYQILVEASAKPTVEALFERAEEHSEERISAMNPQELH